jgi:Trk K+ transport system NAD-binding subunit
MEPAQSALAPLSRLGHRRYLLRVRPPGRVQLYSRYFQLLLWEFRWALAVFWGVVFLGGLVLHLVDRDVTYLKACYGVFLLIFLEASLEFPDEWYLQPFFFLVPLVGLGAVAESLVRLAYLTFTQKRKLQEWQRMVASLYKKHVVVVGVGKVGLQIVRELVALKESVVVVEEAEHAPFLDEVRDLGVPVILGDGRQKKTLEQAGVPRARSIILATDSDLANLDAALTAQDLNPQIAVVLRLFDETLATKVEGAFHMPAVSTARVAAPAFIAAATNRKVYQSFELGGRKLHLVDLTVAASGELAGATVGAVQEARQVNIVMHHGKCGVSVNPPHEVILEAGDTVLVIAPLESLVALSSANSPGDEESAGKLAHRV